MHDQITTKMMRDGRLAVWLGKRRVGTVVKVEGGYQYRPKGSTHLKSAAEVFPSRLECLASL